MRFIRESIPLIAVAVLSGCVATTTQLAPVDPAEVAAEEAFQRELVLTELARQQDRLNDISYVLMDAAVPVCQGKIGPRYGFSYRTIHDYTGPWVAAARNALALTDTPSVIGVTTGSGAYSAGLQKGDRIVEVNGVRIASGKGSTDAVSKAIDRAAGGAVSLTVARSDGTHVITMVSNTICNLGAIVTTEGDINAYADGTSIYFPWAMMRFANDDELRAVVSHEIAHNAMGHIEARKANAALGALFGAIADIALATQGVNTGAQYTSSFMQAAAAAFSQDFEREADYVGMYIMARAGVPLTAGPNLWRNFAQINPSAIGYASTHPTTAERFVRLRAAIEEIEGKRQRGEDLMPEMKESTGISRR